MRCLVRLVPGTDRKWCTGVRCSFAVLPAYPPRHTANHSSWFPCCSRTPQCEAAHHRHKSEERQQRGGSVNTHSVRSLSSASLDPAPSRVRPLRASPCCTRRSLRMSSTSTWRMLPYRMRWMFRVCAHSSNRNHPQRFPEASRGIRRYDQNDRLRKKLNTADIRRRTKNSWAKREREEKRDSQQMHTDSEAAHFH